MRTQLKDALRAAGVGHAWSQPLFRRLHRAALFGRNFGEGDFRWSGELAAMKRIHAARPDASVLFDVGANFGGWSLAAARLWPAAAIHAFEPAADVCARLTAAVADLNVRCVASGVSDRSGEATLFEVPGHPGLSSVHKRELRTYGMEMTQSELVKLTTLDEYCAEQAIDHIDFVKIDVEGHDLSVLRGADNLLAAGKINAIQFEFGGANIDSRTYLRDFVELLTPAYRLSRIVAGGVEPLRYTEREEIFATTNFLAELV